MLLVDLVALDIGKQMGFANFDILLANISQYKKILQLVPIEMMLFKGIQGKVGCTNNLSFHRFKIRQYVD